MSRIPASVAWTKECVVAALQTTADNRLCPEGSGVLRNPSSHRLAGEVDSLCVECARRRFSAVCDAVGDRHSSSRNDRQPRECIVPSFDQDSNKRSLLPLTDF